MRKVLSFVFICLISCVVFTQCTTCHDDAGCIVSKLFDNTTGTSCNTVQIHSSRNHRSEPYLIEKRLKVFPNDLGSSDKEPIKLINKLNKSLQYGYGTWRLPTEEELRLMRSYNILGDDDYMTKENQNGIVRLVADGELGESFREVPKGYVDLGMRSGTLWKQENEGNEYYTYVQAIANFKNNLPTKDQWEELKNTCKWSRCETGYKVTGPNGQHIFLPAAGCQYCNGLTGYVGSGGSYWSSSDYGSDDAWYLFFRLDEVKMNIYHQCTGRSVRLVQ